MWIDDPGQLERAREVFMRQPVATGLPDLGGEPRRPAAKSWIGEVGLILTAVYAAGIIARSSPHLAFAAEGPAGSTLYGSQDAALRPRDAQTAAGWTGKARCIELYDETLSAACRDQHPSALARIDQ